jgi:hypothetical protein
MLSGELLSYISFRVKAKLLIFEKDEMAESTIQEKENGFKGKNFTRIKGRIIPG